MSCRVCYVASGEISSSNNTLISKKEASSCQGSSIPALKVFESKFATKLQLANSLVDSWEVSCEFVEY